MTNSITKLLNIQDSDINVKTKQIINNTKIVEISRNPSPKFCPVCGYRMHSKGIRVRNVNHPVLQYGYRLILEVHQRRFMCTNPDCKELVGDPRFKLFVEECRLGDRKNKQRNLER